MATVINIKSICDRKSERGEVLRGFPHIRRILPISLACEIESHMAAISNGCRLEEIRIRSGRRAYLTVGGQGEKQNVLLSTVVSAEELAVMLEKMCDGSLYAYGESIIKGYISLGEGVRVGICGCASTENGRVLGVYNIHALNIRLPCGYIAPPEKLVNEIRNSVRQGRGVLVYSPPAQGKTTLLRSVAQVLSGGTRPMRTALVDTREELGAMLTDSRLSIDVLSGYPQAEGIRIATAFMNPQVIICDEIGSEEDAMAIVGAQNCGVPLIASAHGGDLEGIMKRSGMHMLRAAGAFGLYVGIRIDGEHGFEYKLQYGKEG